MHNQLEAGTTVSRLGTISQQHSDDGRPSTQRESPAPCQEQDHNVGENDGESCQEEDCEWLMNGYGEPCFTYAHLGRHVSYSKR